jgi:hypothetical protein
MSFALCCGPYWSGVSGVVSRELRLLDLKGTYNHAHLTTPFPTLPLSSTKAKASFWRRGTTPSEEVTTAVRVRYQREIAL